MADIEAKSFKFPGIADRFLPRDTTKIPLPSTAAVGQYFKVSAVDANGVVTAVKAVDAPTGGSNASWKYLGKFETSEEVQELIVSVDSDNNPLNLSKVRVRGVVMPNTVAATGWIRAKINTKIIQNGALVDGMDGTKRTKGRAFQYDMAVVDGTIFPENVLVADSTESVWDILQGGNIAFYQLGYLPTGNAITSVGISGYQAGVLGVGSYIEIWGIDA